MIGETRTMGMTIRRQVIPIAALAALAVLGACSSSDTTTEAGPDTSTTIPTTTGPVDDHEDGTVDPLEAVPPVALEGATRRWTARAATPTPPHPRV